MAKDVIVKFTYPQWLQVLYAIYEAEYRAIAKGENRKDGILLRAERAMKDAEEKLHEDEED